MPRPATGQVIEKATSRGVVFALRFRAYGRREYVTLGTGDDGWTQAKAERELGHVLADVDRGIWKPARESVAAPPEREPTFHEFASEWFASVKGDLRPKTIADYQWQLSHHLLPFFADHTLRQIDVREVDRYRDAKLRERSLGGESINKTLTRLGQILERAVEYELIDRNPVRVGKRKVRTSNAQRSYLDDAAQVADLLASAAELDAEARKAHRHIPRRALVATLALTGLRIGEMTALEWRHVDLATGRLHVVDAKTDAGVRYVTIHPALRDELTAWKATTAHSGQTDPVFASSTGRRICSDHVRGRVFNKAVERANERRDDLGFPALPDSLTPHSLRRTYISALLALGWEVPVVMAEVGHRDPKVTLGIYAKVMRRDDASRERLAGLLDGRLAGSIGQWALAPNTDEISFVRA